MLMRLTSDDQECIVRHLNIFFAENGKGYIRSGGADNQDIEEITWIREAAKNIGAELCSKDGEGLCDELYDNLMYGIEEPEGVVAYLYLAALQAIEMRRRLKKIEDILGDTYDLDRLRELAQADREGRCVVLPCRIGDPVYIIRWHIGSAAMGDETYRFVDSLPARFGVEMLGDFGKTVFRSHKEASDALRKMDLRGENDDGSEKA